MLTEEETALITNNVALAKFLFHKQWARLKNRADYGIDANDLLSQAYYGLVRAAMRYRAYGEERNYSEESIASGRYFSTFARKFIIGQMLDALRKMDHVHPLVRKDYKILVSSGLGIDGKTADELSDDTGLSTERITKVVRAVRSKPVNLEDVSGDQTVGDQLTGTENVEESAIETSLREAWVERWDSLEDRQRVIIALKYYVGMELPDIAEEMGEGLSSVRKLHTEALLDIHDAFVSRLFEA